MTDKIILQNIRIFAYHGCLSEETKIGSNYRVDLIIHANLDKSSTSDQLQDTADYVELQRIVKEEMKIPSKLLEHVAKRINDRVLSEVVLVEKIKTRVSKLNPPINGDVEAVSIEMTKERI